MHFARCLRFAFFIMPLLALTSTACAQQNFFNVPSSDVTAKNKVFFQQQFNVSDGLVQLNTTWCYGLGKGAEVGLNVISLNMNSADFKPPFITNSNTAQSPTYPFYTLNAQKAFQLTKGIKWTIGTQTGFSVGLHFGSYCYSNFVNILPRWRTKLLLGVYGATDSFLGPEDRSMFFPGNNSLGLQFGIEQPLIGDKLFFVAENIDGSHSLGETTFGGAWYFTKTRVLSLGYQFSNPQSKTLEAYVLELTFVPISARH